MSFSAWFIPLLITGLFSWGLCSGVDVFDCFLQGAKEGLKTAASITPALVCLLTVVTMFCHSGALDVLTGFLRPVTQLIGFPAEVLPLALLRPVSGSGGTALLHQLLGEYGPDSFIGRVGSVLAAASETTFYAIAVYYGAVGIRRTRHTMAAALTGDLTAALVSALAVRLLLGVGPASSEGNGIQIMQEEAAVRPCHYGETGPEVPNFIGIFIIYIAVQFVTDAYLGFFPINLNLRVPAHRSIPPSKAGPKHILPGFGNIGIFTKLIIRNIKHLLGHLLYLFFWKVVTPLIIHGDKIMVQVFLLLHEHYRT